MKRIALIVLLCASSLGAAADDELSRLFGMGDPDTFTVTARALERDFHVYVRLPRDYAESDCRWPVVYLLDGGILFPMLAPYHFMLALDGVVPEAIIVGISYGGLGFANGNLRSTDYTAPADEPDYFGGAAAYRDFLAGELLPMIDARYRTDADRRVIVGQSLGGQFVLFSALTRPDLFRGHIAVNPALHRNLDYFLDLEPTEAEPSTRLFVGVGTEDEARFREPAERWIEAWSGRADRPFEMHVERLEGQHHASSAPAAYKAGLRWLLADEAAAGCD